MTSYASLLVIKKQDSSVGGICRMPALFLTKYIQVEMTINVQIYFQAIESENTLLKEAKNNE